MGRLLVAVVGSVQEDRDYNPPLEHVAEARKACEELGRELATQGCDIVVYSNDPKFIEADIVRGYVASGKAVAGSIHVRAPYGKATGFEGFTQQPDLFDHKPDSRKQWEVPFFRSLSSTNGILIVGGGRSTLTTGMIALTLRIPLLAIASFGGSARQVWEVFDTERNYATDEEIAVMAQPGWRPNLAQRLIRSLVDQDTRRVAEKQGPVGFVDGSVVR